MIAYARGDTHYLLYIYDCIRVEVHKSFSNEGLRFILEASKKSCLQRYEKEFFWPLGYRKLLDNSRKSIPKSSDLSIVQDTVLRKLWDWRDRRARDDDESPIYVMANAELLRIGTQLPRSLEELENCGPISSSTRAHALEIIGIVEEQTSVHPEGPREPTPLYGRALKTPSKDVEVVSPSWSPVPAPGGNIGQASASGTLSFTPSLGTSVTAVDRTVASPVEFMETVFEYVGWSKPRGNDDETLAKIRSQLNEVKATNEKRGQSLFASSSSSIPGFAAPDYVHELVERAAREKEKELPSDDAAILEKLPSSLADIYNISNDLRRQKQDNKRRSRDNLDDVIPPAEHATRRSGGSIASSIGGKQSNNVHSILSSMDDSVMGKRAFDKEIYMKYSQTSELSVSTSHIFEKDVEVLVRIRTAKLLS